MNGARVSNGLALACAWIATAMLTSYLAPPLLHHSDLTEAYFWEAWTRLPAYAHDAGDSWRPMIMALDHIRSGDPAPVYEKLLTGGVIKFQYPPSSLLPLSLLEAIGVPHDALPLTLNWLNVIPLAVTIAVTLLIFRRACAAEPDGGTPSRAVAIAGTVAALVLILCFKPLIRSLRLGQAQMWIDALSGLMVLSWASGRERRAGLACGAACLIKPMLGLLVLWAILRRRREFAAAALAVGALGLTASVALYGIRYYLDYFAALSYVSHRGEAFLTNQSVNGLLRAVLHAGTWYSGRLPPYDPRVYAGTVASSAALLAWLLLWRPAAHPARSDADAALALVTSVIASPVAWDHHYAVVLTVYAWLTPRLLRRAPFGRWTGPYLAASFLFLFRDYEILHPLEGTPLVFLAFHQLLGGLMLLVALGRAEERVFWPLSGFRPEAAAA